VSYTAIAGPAGSLEGEISIVAGATRAAVLCHPHPLYGGTLNDSIVGIMAEALTEAGLSTLRFNFRGVGASDGTFDDGKGEAADVRAAAAHLREASGATEIIIAGYSFGAVMALAAAVDAQATRLVLIAPPLSMTSSPIPEIEQLIILGSDDQFVDEASTRSRFEVIGSSFVVTLAGSDHFFQSSIRSIGFAVGSWVKEWN
jgi:alpha/beta superfamily hydrolase